MLDWDDLRYALAVAETGSLAAAGKQLGVNHTTVLRRVNAFETRLGTRLFERLPSGYALTPAGDEAVAVAGHLDETMDKLERRLAGRDTRLSGPLRVTTTDTLAASVLMPHLAAFHAEHPSVALEVSVSNAMANLTRRDADVALRPSSDPPEALVGRRVADIAFAVYGPEGTGPFTMSLDDLAKHPWIVPDEAFAGTVTARWVRRALPSDIAVSCRVDSLLAASEAVRAGLGLAMLPCYLGDSTRALRRVTRPISDARSSLWILTHEDLRRTGRVRAFIEFMARQLGRDRDLLEGRRA